jgi:hypothetical protein
MGCNARKTNKQAGNWTLSNKAQGILLEGQTGKKGKRKIRKDRTVKKGRELKRKDDRGSICK